MSYALDAIISCLSSGISEELLMLGPHSAVDCDLSEVHYELTELVIV